MIVRNRTWPAYVALLIVLALCTLAYRPGLRGDFVFDDYANLPALGAMGPVNSSAALVRYLTSGSADPTGRPLAMASFLIDARDWPADPYSFKRTNLIIHLVNGALLCWFLVALGRLIRRDDEQAIVRSTWAAVLTSALWLMHPLFVSTTMYVVQREAMLPAFFTLAGLLLWLRGRTLLLDGRHCAGALLLILGLPACTALGTLCKANGLLLPALALVIEYVVLRPCTPKPSPATDKRYRRWLLMLAWAPAFVVFAYLSYQGFIGITHGVAAIRPWTLGQRLLTEPRVLCDYLRLLWLPQPYSAGLFNDQVRASVSLWSPRTTLPSLLVVLALLVASWQTRHRHPAFAAALLFYFVGQSMESSTIALELYFEHRNYVPALLMFWPIALWLCDDKGFSPMPNALVRKATSKTLLTIKYTLAICIPLALAALTWANADLWGNTHDQALLWAERNPHSPRAQAYAANTEMLAGRPDRAASRLAPLLDEQPAEVQIALNLFAAECQMGSVSPPTWRHAREALRTTRDPGTLLANWFGHLIDEASQPQCPQADLDHAQALLRDALDNKLLTAVPGRSQDLLNLLGRISLSRGDAKQALEDFDRALAEQPREPIAFSQAALLGATGHPREGLAHLATFEQLRAQERPGPWSMVTLHSWVLKRQGYWEHELATLRATLTEDASALPSQPNETNKVHSS
ncbi:tetratricopeptide repeat protein [Pinirhizobacter soli]|uniref:tetratricopeptide repeat protein n=1 Tax=Pinirhizobacter soli TaxID=2786953 RepID=UPI002029C61D|nr:tetratricopeptide repeat protein [Pinirhizobacter soli]